MVKKNFLMTAPLLIDVYKRQFLQMTLVIPIWDAMVARFILLIWTNWHKKGGFFGSGKFDLGSHFYFKFVLVLVSWYLVCVFLYVVFDCFVS